jgi:hypothetical protein
MVVFILSIMLLTNPDSAKIKAYNDSLVIYEAYKDQIEAMKKYADSSNYDEWYKRQAYDDSITVCKFLSLKKYNKRNYDPEDSLEMEGFGIAYKYPKPHGFKEKTDTIKEPDVLKFTKIDLQTKFIVDKNNFTRIPYLDLLYYNSLGRIYKIEKINPVTLQKIPY